MLPGAHDNGLRVHVAAGCERYAIVPWTLSLQMRAVCHPASGGRPARAGHLPWDCRLQSALADYLRG